MVVQFIMGLRYAFPRNLWMVILTPIGQGVQPLTEE